MANQQTIHYELSDSADLRRLVEELAEIEAATVIVAFHDTRGWKPTDLEMARLVASARSFGKQLIAERGSSSTAERAVLIGFRDTAVVSDRPSVNLQDTTAYRPEAETEIPTAVITPHDRFDSTANLATYRPADEQQALVWHRSGKQESEESPEGTAIGRAVAPTTSSTTGTFFYAPEVTGKPVPTPEPVTSPAPAPVHAARTESNNHQTPNEQHYPPVEVPRMKQRRRRIGILKLAAAIIAPIVVIGVTAAMVVYTLPTAAITLVPEEEPVTSSLTYGIAAANASFDIMIDPTPLSATLSAEASTEATGERFEAAGNASGVIQITNPLTNDVTIPAGTEILGANGVTYYTTEDVQIPAADPSGSLAFGSGSVGVYAGTTGPDGNIDAGTLTGHLGSQMFYTNPNAITGGRMDRYPVIDEEDVEAVQVRVAEELTENARDAFMADVPDAMEVVPGTLEIGEPEIEISADAGDDGEQVSASGTISVRGKIYDPEELHERAGDEADRLLTRQARQGGADRILLAETVTKNEPTDLDGVIPAYQIDVEAMARKVITESEKQAIIEEITGLSRNEAEEVLANHPKVERYQITIEPDWMLDRMPEIASRISIHVSSGEPTASTR